MNKLLLILLCCTFFIACDVSAPNNNDATTDNNSTDTLATAPPADTVVMTTTTANTTIKDYSSFIPNGYKLYKTFKGNLNRDQHEDVLLVLEPTDDPDNMTNRAVVLLTSDANGQLTQAAYNKNAMLCKECGGIWGDPFSDVVIKDGYFTLEHYAGSSDRWTNDPTFKYNKDEGKWYLHKISVQTYSNLDPENSHKTTITTTKDFGKVDFEDFNIGG